LKSLTPSNQEESLQLSVLLHGEGRSLFEYLMKNGVITDWREPNVIRLAPVPLFFFEDMYHLEILKAVFLINRSSNSIKNYFDFITNI
jgi:kynureninase